MTMAALLMMNQFNRHDDGPMPCPQDLYFPIFYRPEVSGLADLTLFFPGIVSISAREKNYLGSLFFKKRGSWSSNTEILIH